MADVTNVIDFLMNLKENAKGTIFESYVQNIFIIVTLLAIIKILVIPFIKCIKKIYDYFSQNIIIKKIYPNLSFMESSDIYYAIKQFIPTRFSTNDPGNEDEPAPVYEDTNNSKDSLLIERFCKFEFNQKNGIKYYLCLADCGMGKTTFLINLYYRILKHGKYQCRFISLQESNCINQINEVSEKGKIILLLDALDENNEALINYNDFMENLERATREFYRVIITSRTNFFENESKEQLTGQYKASGISSKLQGVRKFYITPFTDEDIKRFLKMRYPLNRKKQKKAWNLIERNINLSVRPLLLRFINEVLADDTVFEYDFQLYECLFQKWIDREKRSFSDTDGMALYNECLCLAKAIYYQWMKNGKIGVSFKEFPNNKLVPSFEDIQLKGHAMLNRTSDGLFKFSHRSYWEYMLAKLALSDVYFANDLLIKNFDRAVSFLEEMIQYYQGHYSEQTVEVLMGIANYMMKYNRPEDAENQYRNAISLSSENDQFKLLAMIQIAKCLHRQLKYKSAAIILKKCHENIEKLQLKEDTLSLYAQFGEVYAEHCRINHLKAGQDFLKQVIEYYTINGWENYDLFRCYESYCYCCINLFLQQQALLQMDQLKKEKFQDDQYIEYLWDKAHIWSMDYKNPLLYKIIKKLEESDKRFMDSFEQIICYCDLGISGFALNSWDNITAKYLEEAYILSNAIANDNGKEDLHSPYVVKVYQKTIIAYHLFNTGKRENEQKLEKDCIDYIINYMYKNDLLEEMSSIYFLLLGYIQEDDLCSDDEIYYISSKRLKIAEDNENIYDLINAHRSFYKVYSLEEEAIDKSLGQEHLKQAFILGKNNDDFYMTISYCDLLQELLSSYVEGINKTGIANELLDIISEVYGNDTRCSHIYRELREYFSAQNDKQEVKSCLELLRYAFGFFELNYFYDSCSKYDCLKIFIPELDRICIEKGVLSNEEIFSLKKFMDNRKDEMIVSIYASLKSLLKRIQSLQMEANVSWPF